MTAIALPVRMGDLGADLIPRRSRRMPDPDKAEQFKRDVALLFPDGQSARLARALDNSPRNAQKWINGAEDAPPHATEFVDEQMAILRKMRPHPYDTMKLLVDNILASGLHPEVVAGILSRLYDDVTGKAIR